MAHCFASCISLLNSQRGHCQVILVSPSFSKASRRTLGPDFRHEFSIRNDSISIFIEFLSDRARLLVGDEEATALHQVPYLFCGNKAVSVQVTYSESFCGVEVGVPAQVLPESFGLIFTT